MRPDEPRAAHQTADNTRRRRDRLDSLAWLLDNAIPLPGGFRIGVEALLGLIPFFGDAAGALVSAYIIREAARLGAPPSLILRMAMNVAIDGLIGAIPFAGDVFDAAWKANQRNVRLLNQHLANPQAAVRSSRLLVAIVLALLFAFLALMIVLSVRIVIWIWDSTAGA